MKNRISLFVFMGPPGAGKGSLSSICTQKLGWVQLSTGNLCRKHIAEQTEIGKQIDFAMKSGKLVSDSLITSAVDTWFAENSKSASAIILDGYPRTVAQARALHELLTNKGYPVELNVIKLSIQDEKILVRLGNRYICENIHCQTVYSLADGSRMVPKIASICDHCNCKLVRRKDDHEDAVKERLKIYYKHEQDLLHFFSTVNQPIKHINVEKTLDEIFDEFKNLVGVIVQ